MRNLGPDTGHGLCLNRDTSHAAGVAAFGSTGQCGCPTRGRGQEPDRGSRPSPGSAVRAQVRT
jgi:hypothetical protein